MATTRESTPPPVIGKVGRYTVFMTPPATPRPAASEPRSQSLDDSITALTKASSNKSVAPPVQPPPQHFAKTITTSSSNAPKSPFAFFWNAVSTVQNAHGSLDEYLAGWFGLDNSKYQWALDDYYETKGMENGNTKQRDQTRVGPNV